MVEFHDLHLYQLREAVDDARGYLETVDVGVLEVRLVLVELLGLCGELLREGAQGGDGAVYELLDGVSLDFCEVCAEDLS